MHFFGGIVVTFFLVWLLYHLYRTWREKGAAWRIIILNSGLFIVVAILWEIMEFSVQHAFDIYGVLATPVDSVSDIICGLVGSLVALLYYFMKVKRHG